MSAGRRRRKRHQLDIVYNVDASDPIGNWYHAKIVGRRGERLKIHYVGWNSRHDAWLPTDRIAPYGTKTGYKGTIGPKERTWDRRVKLDLLMERLDRIQQQTAAELKVLREDMSSQEGSEEDSGSSPSPKKDEDCQAELDPHSRSLNNEELDGEESARSAYSVDECSSQGSRTTDNVGKDRNECETAVEPVNADRGHARHEGSSLVSPFGGEPTSEEDSGCEVDILREDDEEDKAMEKAKLLGTMKSSSGILDKLVANVEEEKANVAEQTVEGNLERMLNSSIGMSKATDTKLLRNPPHTSENASSVIGMSDEVKSKEHQGGEFLLSADSWTGSIRLTDDKREGDAEVVNRSPYKQEEIDVFHSDYVEGSDTCRIVWDVHPSPTPSKEVNTEGGGESSAKFVDVVQQSPRTEPNDSTVAGPSSQGAASAEKLREDVPSVFTKKEKTRNATASLVVIPRGDNEDVPKGAPHVEDEVRPTSATHNDAEQPKRVSHAQSSASHSISAASRIDREPKASLDICHRQSTLLLEDEKRESESIPSSAEPEWENPVATSKDGHENREAGHSVDTASGLVECGADSRRSTPQRSSCSESTQSSANGVTPVPNNAPAALQKATPPVSENNVLAKEEVSASAHRQNRRPRSSKLVIGTPGPSLTVMTNRKADGGNSVVRKSKCFLVCQDAEVDVSRKWKSLKELDSASLFQMLREKVSVDEGSVQNSEREKLNLLSVSAKTDGAEKSVAESIKRIVDQVVCAEGEFALEAREKSPKKEDEQHENSLERHGNEGHEAEESAHSDETIVASWNTDLQRERANETEKGELAPKDEDGSVKVAVNEAMSKAALVSMTESIIRRETCNILELTINSITKPPDGAGGSCNDQSASLTRVDPQLVCATLKPEKNSQGPDADDSFTRSWPSTVILGMTKDHSKSDGREPILKVGCSQKEMKSAEGRSKDKFLRQTSSSPLKEVVDRGRGMSMKSAGSQRIRHSSSGRVNEGKTHGNDSTVGAAGRDVVIATSGRPSPARAIRTSCRRRTATSKEFYSEVTPSPRKRARRDKADPDAKEDPASPERIKAKPLPQQPEPASVSEMEVREFLLRREDGSRFAAFVPPVWALLKGLNELTDLTYGGRRAARREKAKESEEKRRQELERARRILSTSGDWGNVHRRAGSRQCRGMEKSSVCSKP